MNKDINQCHCLKNTKFVLSVIQCLDVKSILDLNINFDQLLMSKCVCMAEPTLHSESKYYNIVVEGSQSYNGKHYQTLVIGHCKRNRIK